MPIPLVLSAKVIVNVNSKEEPLQFYIEGEKLVLALFMVKIIEEKDKTNEEIKIE